nr:hypothetical protein [Cystobacter sp.]
MALRVLAVSAPDYPEGRLGSQTLNSSDPASLFNACRYAALLAQQGGSAWGESNWAVPRLTRRNSVLLMRSWREQRAAYEALLQEVQPNLLLLGAMTLALPGAIACARVARELFGDRICIVLGGRHASETVYTTPGQPEVQHHPGSPLRLMAEGAIPHDFDLVVSGDGECVIAALGELVAECEKHERPAALARRELSSLREVPGRWIAGFVEDGRIHTVESQGRQIDRNQLPSPAEMFGVRTAFDVFDGRLTAHVFSDTGRGCAYDCAFCSERSSVTGKLEQFSGSPRRLFHQLASAVRVIGEDSPTRKASAFVEDSVMLGGSIAAMDELSRFLSEAQLDLRFGAQLTLDQILRSRASLAALRENGLDYMFIGLETFEPGNIGGMSKDLGHMRGRWISRAEKALELLASLDIRCGVAVLFGLGETHENRLQLFEQLQRWRGRFGFPEPISLNWAVQHPLKGFDGGTGYRYFEWGTPPGPYLDAFQDFGEASLHYPVAGCAPPTLEALSELRSAFRELYRDPMPTAAAQPGSLGVVGLTETQDVRFQAGSKA